MKDVSAILELYRASEMIISQNESALEKQNLWSKNFLKEYISCCRDSKGFTDQISKQVLELVSTLPWPMLSSCKFIKSLHLFI